MAKSGAWWLVNVSLRNFLLSFRMAVLRYIYGMNIGRGVRISLKANIDRTNPRGVHIGDDSYIAFDVAILTHDMSRLTHQDVRIGKCCFIGARSIILPGVVLGDHVVVAAGSVVTKSVDSNSLIAGNPARVIRRVNTSKQGIIIPFDE